MESSVLRSVSSPLLLDNTDLHLRRIGLSSSPRFSSTVVRCSSKNHAYIPKLEPFSRTKLDRAIKEPPLIEKSENELADYCSTLEGDDSYSCWKAYFELKDLEKESPKQEVEKLILQAGGVKSLIGCLHGITAIQKRKGKEKETRKPWKGVEGRGRECPIPDGLPKSAEEIEEEEEGRMPDSPFTRLLRSKGAFPAWYSPAPDHETD
ncbi:CCG-binding protein 1 [Benincasa hispida]|uniref:CCG-binding protein 1 n=1 Tax=Benincasa hispida TaxID=102211 RepID=UPI00190060AC|nr:CCG-binding protein 1 [Benincasa hispida]